MATERTLRKKKYRNTKKGRLVKRLCEINYKRKTRLIILETLGGKCLHCGFSDKRALQVDHIYGGGNRDRKSNIKNAQQLLRDILLNENKYQLLCANCNWIKRFENNEYKKL